MHGNGAESMYAYCSQRERLWGLLLTAYEDGVMEAKR